MLLRLGSTVLLYFSILPKHWSRYGMTDNCENREDSFGWLLTILKLYLIHRKFQVKTNNATSKSFDIKAKVPQINVMGLILYLLFTADLPVLNKIIISTFADDTADLAENSDAVNTSRSLHEYY